VSYNLFSPTVPLGEVIFPSVTVCNMNTLRRSLVYTLLEDPDIKDLNVSYSELKKIIHLVYIDGGDYELNNRETLIVDSEFIFSFFLSFSSFRYRSILFE
jgi:hypothetical protein